MFIVVIFQNVIVIFRTRCMDGFSMEVRCFSKINVTEVSKVILKN